MQKNFNGGAWWPQRLELLQRPSRRLAKPPTQSMLARPSNTTATDTIIIATAGGAMGAASVAGDISSSQ